MSFYVTFVGKVKIKPEFVEDMKNLYEGKYGLIKDPDIKLFLRNAARLKCVVPLKNWDYWYEKREWIDKYDTALEGDIFTYGASFNVCGGFRDFFEPFFYKILPYVTEQVIEEDYAEES